MQNIAQTGEILVRENQPLHLRHATIIRCTAGTVWITSAGEKQDFFLSTGQSHRCQGRGLTLIEGIGEGRIRLENNEQTTIWLNCRTAVKRLWRKLFSRTGQAASAPGWFA